MHSLLVWTWVESSLPVKQGTSTATVYVRALIIEERVRDLPAPEIDHTTLNLYFEADFRKPVHESNYELAVEYSV